MSVKEINITDVGMVSFYKRKGARSLKLSITHDGKIRVTLPTWAPYITGVKFVESRKEWILSQVPESNPVHQGMSIGKAHHITYESGSGSTISGRITGNQIRVILPPSVRWNDKSAQDTARNTAIKALKKEARMLLPHRLKTLAEQHGYSYNSVTIKQLKGRWGSCSDKKDITFNCYLMQLPWELIDYVILHELAHTKVMAHGPVFWAEMERVLPAVQVFRKQIKSHKPAV